MRNFSRTSSLYEKAVTDEFFPRGSPPFALRHFRIAWVLILLVSAATAPNGVAADHQDPREKVLIRVREMIAALRGPLVVTERHPFLRLLSHLGASHPEPHLAAILALAESNVPAASYALVEVLDDPGFPYRAEAAEALGFNPDRIAVEPLIRALDDRDSNLRRIAARTLGAVVGSGIASRRQIRVARLRLAAILKKDPDPGVRTAALYGLFDIGGEFAFRVGFGTIKHDRHFLVQCERLALHASFVKLNAKKLEDDANIRDAQRMFRKILAWDSVSRSPGSLGRAFHITRNYSAMDARSYCVDVREIAVTTLGALHDEASVPMLAALAESAGVPALRSTAVRALAEFESGEAFEAIGKALDDEIWSVRHAAIRALRRSKDPRAAWELAATLERGAAIDRLAAARANRIRADALVRALADPIMQVRRAAGQTLLQISARVGILENELSDEHSRTPSAEKEPDHLMKRRIQAEGRLRKWRAAKNKAEQALARALSDDDERVGRRAARILAAFEGEGSRRLLIAELNRAVSPGSEMAALALGLHGDEEARQSLERSAAAADVRLAVASIRALQDLVRPESLPVLRALGQDAVEEEVRSAARLASAMLERAPLIDADDALR